MSPSTMSIKTRIHGALRPLANLVADKWFAHAMSYSAAGEDQIALGWLETGFGIDITKARYCDIGANHPTELNNTFLLYQLGASGVLVEPDPDLCDALARKRRRDIVLNVGVAFDERRSASLRRLSGRVFNTFLTERADLVVEDSKAWQPYQRQEIIDDVETALVPANDILAEHFADGIDFLSIDAEGVDQPILESIDFDRFRPRVICIEASESLDPIMRSAGYERVARTPHNEIFRLINKGKINGS